MQRATRFERAEKLGEGEIPEADDTVTLAHDERHVRRKALPLAGGEKILVDLPEPVMLGHGDRLILENGRQIAVLAAEEPLYAVTPLNALHLSQLCWHIGNRHLAAQIEERRILILRDHVIKTMLEGLGAGVENVIERFMPVRGAYSGHGHAHGHHHHHEGGHDHHHG